MVWPQRVVYSYNSFHHYHRPNLPSLREHSCWSELAHTNTHSEQTHTHTDMSDGCQSGSPNPDPAVRRDCCCGCPPPPPLCFGVGLSPVNSHIHTNGQCPGYDRRTGGSETCTTLITGTVNTPTILCRQVRHSSQIDFPRPTCCKADVDYLLSRPSISTFGPRLSGFGPRARSKGRTPVFPQLRDNVSRVCSAVYVAGRPRLLRALRPDPGTQAHLSPAAENWVTAQPKASGSV